MSSPTLPRPRPPTLKGESAPEQLTLELKAAKEQLGQFQRKLFGDSSERRPQEKPPKETSTKRGHGRTAQDRLPRSDTLVELDDDGRVCPACDGELEAIDGVTEDSELIDVIERQFIVRTIKRQKYRCRCNGAIQLVPPPVKHIARGRYSLDFGAHAFGRKYGWHEPFDRQRRAMKLHGLDISTQALWDQVEAIAGTLEPVYEALRDYIVVVVVVVVVVGEAAWAAAMARRSRESLSLTLRRPSSSGFCANRSPTRRPANVALRQGAQDHQVVVLGDQAHRAVACEVG